MEEVRRRGELVRRLVDDQALVKETIGVGAVAVGGQKRENRDQTETLAQDVPDTGVVRMAIQDVEREDRLRHGVHNVAAGQLQDRIVDKLVLQGAVFEQHVLEVPEFADGREASEQDEVGDLLETAAFLADKAVREVADVIPAIQQPSRTGGTSGFHRTRGGLHVADLGQPCDDALPVDIAKPAFHVVFREQGRIELTLLEDNGG